MQNAQEQYWKRIRTTQFEEGILHLQEKLWERGRSGMLIGTTGLGKTYMIDRFCANPKITAFRVTASKAHKLKDILNELLDMMDFAHLTTVTNHRKLHEKEKVDLIVRYLISIQAEGKKSIIVIDEAENVDISVLKTIKTFYDALVNICAIVLIGTPELLEKMLNKMSRHRGGIPQLYRRLKAGTKILTPLNAYEQFPNFFKEFNVTDTGIQKLLYEVASNYGELHDYLEPVIREAKLTEQPLTEQLFRDYWDMPKLSRKIA
jgi:DNA transposition AAA+ family ATPase